MASGRQQDKQIYIGQSVPRLEDPPMVTGEARYAADINFPGQIHMRMVRSQPARKSSRS